MRRPVNRNALPTRRSTWLRRSPYIVLMFGLPAPSTGAGLLLLNPPAGITLIVALAAPPDSGRPSDCAMSALGTLIAAVSGLPGLLWNVAATRMSNRVIW